MSSLTSHIHKLRNSSLARNAGWMLMGQGIGFVLQIGYFILLARLLGAREYGIFAGAFAFAGIAAPYSTLGSGTIFMRHASASGRLCEYWGNILLSTAAAGSLLTLVLWLVGSYFLNPDSSSIIVEVALANCLLAQLVSSMGQVFQTFELLGMTAFLSLLTNALRLIAVSLMAIVLSHATAREWAQASVYVSLVAAIVAFILVARKLGRPSFVPKMVLSNATEGLGFSLGGSAQSVYNDFDKTLLCHYGLNLQNGIYTMAYRVVDIATMPITAMDAAALPRYFNTTTDNPRKVPPFALRLARSASLVGLMMGGVAFLLAPLIPHVLGGEFTQSVRALRWLCLLPAMRGIHQLTGSAITGMGHQRLRTIGQFSAAGLNLSLNLWLIPQFGWLGAAWASAATDGSLAIANWAALAALRRRLDRGRQDDAGVSIKEYKESASSTRLYDIHCDGRTNLKQG